MSPSAILILNLFLYFPKDKREYIPAFISLSIFALLAVLTFIIIVKVNKKQLEKAEKIEKKILRHHRW